MTIPLTVWVSAVDWENVTNVASNQKVKSVNFFIVFYLLMQDVEVTESIQEENDEL